MRFWKPSVLIQKEDRQSARDELSRRKLRESQESVDELARDLEKLLDKASPGLPAANRNAELRYHLLNALPEKVSLQLKLLPKTNYSETISKARELLLLFHRTDMPTSAVNQIQTKSDENRLKEVEETLQQMSQQLAALSVHRMNGSGRSRCFKCWSAGTSR